MCLCRVGAALSAGFRSGRFSPKVILALISVILACEQLPINETGRPLEIEHDAMTGKDHGCYELSQAYRDVTSVGYVKVHEDQVALVPVEYLLWYESGPFEYTRDHRTLVGLELPDTAWQVYLLDADKCDEFNDEPGENPLLGQTFYAPALYNEAMAIVYAGTIRNMVDHPAYECWSYDYDTACRAVTLHELGHTFNLPDVEPVGGDVCESPGNSGIMVAHHSLLILEEYSSDEEQALSSAGRP